MRVTTMSRSVAALAVLLLGAACSDTTAPRTDEGETLRPTGGMTIVPSGASMRPGQVVQLRAHLITSSGDALAQGGVSWWSSKEFVAAVSQNGQVFARNPGLAVISAQAQGKTQIATIRVLPHPTPGKPNILNLKANVEPGRRAY